MGDSGANGSGSSDSCSVRLRGLPWSCKEGEIRKFFADIGENIKTIHFTMNREGRPSGEAYVEFVSPDDVSKALEYNNESIGSRYIEVFECKSQEMSFVMKHRNDRVGSGEEAIVRMRGLPFGITKDEIAQFYIGLEIVPNGILLPVDMSGRSTGEAFVQFADKPICEKAMEKHMERIGHRYIEVFRSSQDEVKHAMWKLNTPSQQADPYGAGGGGYGGGRGGSYGGGAYGGGGGGAQFGMLPYAMRETYGHGGAGRARMSPYSRDPSGGAGGGGGYAASYGGMPQMQSMPAKALGAGYGGGGGGAFGGGAGMGYSGIGDYSSGFPAAGGRPSAKPGKHCVHMRGLPYRATESDVRMFFEPLQVVSVNFETDDTGRPSGECDVKFYSHVDAVDAMKKDRECIGSRYVELFLESTAADVKGGGGGGGGGMMGAIGAMQPGFGGGMKMF